MFRTSLKVTHLMYADDLVIYAKANVQEAKAAAECLQSYCDWTGQQISWEKFIVHFSPNTLVSTKMEISEILQIPECNHSGKYLGHSFCNLKSESITFKEVFEKMANKLSGWKRRVLSTAGRLVLIKSVVQALPTFIMQTYMLPSGLTKKWINFVETSSGQYRKHLTGISILKPGAQSIHLGRLEVWGSGRWRISTEH